MKVENESIEFNIGDLVIKKHIRPFNNRREANTYYRKVFEIKEIWAATAFSGTRLLFLYEDGTPGLCPSVDYRHATQKEIVEDELKSIFKGCK